MRSLVSGLAALLLAAGAAGAQENTANPLAGVGMESLRGVLDRPLFNPSRRPPLARPAPLAAPEPVALRPDASQLRLLGTLVGPARSSAMILDAASGTTRSLALGDTVNGWRLAEIEHASVRLEQERVDVVLTLFRPGSPARPASAAGAQPAPVPPVASAPPAFVPPQTASPATPVLRSPSAVPQGTVAGTAAAEAASESPFRLTFGDPPAPPAAPR